MKSFFVTLFTALAVSPLAHALTVPSQPHAVDVTGKMEWHGMSNGNMVTLYGTASEIKEQLMTADPNWVPANHNSTSLPILSKQSVGDSICCPVSGQPWTPVSIESIQIAMNRLMQIGGYVVQGPRSCQVSISSTGLAACVLGAGITVCNDNDYTLFIPCSFIAGYAAELIDQCHGSNGRVCGQQFDTDNYNVIIAGC